MFSCKKYEGSKLYAGDGCLESDGFSIRDPICFGEA